MAGQDALVRVGDDEVAVTHLDRVYWPAWPERGQGPITKRDYLRYLVDVAAAMLPHVRDRPLTLFRWPEGIARRRVLEKHWIMQLPAFVARESVFSESKQNADQYILCNNLATLLWLAQMGVLELHAWHSRVRPGRDAPDAGRDFASSAEALQHSLLERPDYLLFDIDPFIGAAAHTRRREPVFDPRAFERSRDVALWLEELLAGLSLESLVKTSGKTGLHVIVPIRRTLAFAAVREIARFIAQHVLRAHPGVITLDWSVGKRAGKIFLDANMNVRGKSITVPYSPRGRPGAPVSMPLTWQALRRADARDFRITTVVQALQAHGDAWAGWLDRKQDVERTLAAVAAA